MSLTINEGPGGGPGGGSTDPRLTLLHELREQNLDLIRFASYRTACKLRYVQKKCNLHVIDIWNVIEAFRENGLNTLEGGACVNVSRLETLLSSLYHNLNKRLPPAHQVSVEACSALLLNWLLSAYTTGDNVGKIRVFSIKVALATMCAGKLMDKLRYMFSQLSDGNGHLMLRRLAEYLREALALPAAVYESPSFSYDDSLAGSIFTASGKITVNDFMDTMMADPGPPSLVWLPLLHRLASVENVVHPLACSACRRSSMTGFRYRCTRCSGYALCQDCFWRGRVSAHHTNEHEVKEYTTYKSPSKQIGHTLRKSFRCVPERARPALPRYPDQPERTLNLSHIVPPSPVPMHNGFPESGAHNTGSLDSRASRATHRSMAEHMRRGTDDEHQLIARYAARLAHENKTMPRVGRSASLTPDEGLRTPSDSSIGLEASRAQRELINQLEGKNREIMREIARLRRQQELETGAANAGSGEGSGSVPLVSELRALRQRKGELEGHLSSLQDSRKHLMGQLEGLMRMLKTHQSSPRSTPNSSPRSGKSPPLPGSQPAHFTERTSGAGTRSAPQTPSLSDRERERIDNTAMTQSLGMDNMTNEMRLQYSQANQRNRDDHNGSNGVGGRSLRSDLLFAADSVTNAMSTLVRELNSEGSDAEDGATVGRSPRKPRDFEEDMDEDDDADDEGPAVRPHRLYQASQPARNKQQPSPAPSAVKLNT